MFKDRFRHFFCVFGGVDRREGRLLRGQARAAVIALSFLSGFSLPAGAADPNFYRFDEGLKLGEAHLFDGWWQALQRNTLQRVEFDLCLAKFDTCARRLRPLRQLVIQGRNLTTEDKLQLVNRYLNRRDYDDDSGFNNADELVDKRNGPRSHWSTLFEFLRRGGDCEDYASSKYFLLRLLGLKSDQMRVVVAKESMRRGHHAVLAYRWENGSVWLLESDNVIKKTSHRGYRYIYAINEHSIWDYRAAP